MIPNNNFLIKSIQSEAVNWQILYKKDIYWYIYQTVLLCHKSQKYIKNIPCLKIKHWKKYFSYFWKFDFSGMIDLWNSNPRITIGENIWKIKINILHIFIILKERKKGSYFTIVLEFSTCIFLMYSLSWLTFLQAYCILQTNPTPTPAPADH